MYQIKYQKKAVKFLKKSDPKISKKIIKKLEHYSQKPNEFDKALSGDKKGYWRYRVENYSIICQIKRSELIIIVIDIDHRSEIYKTKY